MVVRRSADAGRMAATVSRPGIDPRTWVTLASVTSVYADLEENVFADVVFIPTGEPETAMLGGPYAGKSFGAYFPIAVDDTVLVAIPSGDPQLGPVIIARMWSKADTPPPEIGTGSSGTPARDVTIRVEPGQKFKIRTSDSGDGVSIVVEGNGDIVLTPQGAGKVYLGGDIGTEPGAKGQTLQQYMSTIRDAYNGHTHPDPQGGVTGAPVPLFVAVPTITTDKVEVK